jgi:hypothetical protein
MPATPQTVSFQCGHCRKVMGVTVACLGKQVRCPHCQQVVMAPATAPPAAPPRPPSPAPNFSAPPGPSKDEHESIFGEHIDEDLFGSAPKAKVELPAEPARQNLQLEPTVFNVPGLPPMPAGPELAPTITSHSATGIPDSGAGALATAGTAVAAAPGWSAAVPAPATDGAPSLQAPARKPESKMMLVYILIGVAGYALLMTLLAIKYYMDLQGVHKPLELLPDTGDPKAQPVSERRTEIRKRLTPTTELDPKLRTELGKPIRLGDLEITPTKVEEKRLVLWRGTTKYPPQDKASLVLHLSFKNVSTNAIFRPTDPQFDYEWSQTRPKDPMPYTFLTVNGTYCCGVFPRPVGANSHQDERIEGQEEDTKDLKPGDTSKTVIVTNYKEDVPSLLPGHKGKLLWRVQLRRGLVKLDDGKLRSATGVIGVEFDKGQIEAEK